MGRADPWPLLRRAGLVGLTGLVALALPAVAFAHPLGNFTINTYAGIRVSPEAIQLDVVLDQAEIPTFEDRLRLDRDGDGELSEDEVAVAREPECRTLARGLALSVDGAPLAMGLRATGLSFPPGAGGLSTMRLVCELVAPLASPLAGPATIVFTNRVHAERLGWREIVVDGDGTTVAPVEGPIRASSISGRLTSYPTTLLSQPPTESAVTFRVTPGGAALAPLLIRDAEPLPGFAASEAPRGGPASTAGAGGTAVDGPAGAIPGGVGADVPSIFRSADLSPAIVVLALLTAIALGAGHALTPGHGKTLMAAYLVGTRGTVLHAAGLGLSVTVSHTLGILGLAVLVSGVQGALAPDVVVRFMPAIAALTIVAIGGWMLVSELRRRGARRKLARLRHRWAGDRGRSSAMAAVHEHDHTPDHGGHEDHYPGHDQEHSHGGVRHTHPPPAGTTITWRSLFALGLAGGLIPSTNALLILLGTIATGRTAFGIVLVVAFGLGMAVVLSGVGLAMVLARDWLDRASGRAGLGRLVSAAPLVASVAVLGLGLWLAGQAIVGRAVL